MPQPGVFAAYNAQLPLLGIGAGGPTPSPEVYNIAFTSGPLPLSSPSGLSLALSRAGGLVPLALLLSSPSGLSLALNLAGTLDAGTLPVSSPAPLALPAQRRAILGRGILGLASAADLSLKTILALRLTSEPIEITGGSLGLQPVATFRLTGATVALGASQPLEGRITRQTTLGLGAAVSIVSGPLRATRQVPFGLATAPLSFGTGTDLRIGLQRTVAFARTSTDITSPTRSLHVALVRQITLDGVGVSMVPGALLFLGAPRYAAVTGIIDRGARVTLVARGSVVTVRGVGPTVRLRDGAAVVRLQQVLP